MNSLKSFSELGDLYEKSVFLTESKETKDKDFGFKKAGKQKSDGPEAAEGFKKDLDETKDTAEEPKTEKAEKPAKKDDKKKEMKESTTTSTKMETKKLSFDELYERAMNEGPDSVVSPVTDDAVAGDVGAPVGGEADENPSEVTTDVGEEVADPKELFGQLCEIIDKLKAHYGIEEDELGAGEQPVETDSAEVDIEDLSKESVETEELPASKGQSLQGKNNKVPAVKVSGKGKADTGKLTSDPTPKALGDKGKTLQGKSNKVGGTGAQSKVGASALES